MTPAGWVRSNLLYEKYDGLPEPGSWLESVFFVVWTKRQEQAVAKSWLEVVASMPSGVGEERLNAIAEARKEYVQTLHPYLGVTQPEQKAKEKSEEHEALEAFAKGRVRIDLRPVFRAQIAQRKTVMQRSSLPRVRKKR